MRTLALRTVSLLVLATLGSISGMPAARADDGSDQQFGKVHFQTSCNQVAQRRFDRGMRYQHSFWYRPAKEIFEETLQADPECTIAYWGIALSLLYNPHFPAPKENLTEGLAALQKAKALGAKSDRERDYIDALLAFYSGDEKTTFGERAQAYLKAAEAVAARYPDDDEAQIAYAITLNVTASPSDKTYANQLKGAAILEPIFKRQPRHPGVAHYLIHLYDYPAIAERGLDAAKRYSEIAPAAPHALHMPSHIFTRVGYWNESIEANSRSAKAAKEGKDPSEQLHAEDYMVYALLQLAQGRPSQRRRRGHGCDHGLCPAVRAGPYATAASQARYMVERGDWQGAAALKVQPSRFAYVDAITYFARAVGAARSGNAEAATADIAKLAELRDKLQQDKDAYWAEIVDIQRQVATAWQLYGQGKQADALEAMRLAADAEDKTEKSIVTPGPLAPARELYGAMLLERGMATEALAAFESTMRKEPNRFGATIGAAHAAEKAGDAVKARQYYAKVIDMGRNGDSSRVDLVAARKFMIQN
jgi:tetratricopeptide (TPR) repeat protein